MCHLLYLFGRTKEELNMLWIWQKRAFWSLFMILALGALGCAQVSEQDLKREIEILKKNQEELRKEVEQLKAMVQGNRPKAPSVRDVEFELGDNPIEGDSAALLTLVEFTDYQ
jgi:protein-disulfide isomerase